MIPFLLLLPVVSTSSVEPFYSFQTFLVVRAANCPWSGTGMNMSYGFDIPANSQVVAKITQETKIVKDRIGNLSTGAHCYAPHCPACGFAGHQEVGIVRGECGMLKRCVYCIKRTYTYAGDDCSVPYLFDEGTYVFPSNYKTWKDLKYLPEMKDRCGLKKYRDWKDQLEPFY